MSEERKLFTDHDVKPFDIIEIIPSHYAPSHKIGNKYVVVGSLDGFDAEIIDENGEYSMVCGEDYKVIGNVTDKRKAFCDKIPVVTEKDRMKIVSSYFENLTRDQFSEDIKKAFGKGDVND